MKKIIYGLLAALFLIGCQQPTIDYNNFSDIDPSRPEVELEEETIEDEQQEEIVEEEIVIEEDLTKTEDEIPVEEDGETSTELEAENQSDDEQVEENVVEDVIKEEITEPEIDYSDRTIPGVEDDSDYEIEYITELLTHPSDFEKKFDQYISFGKNAGFTKEDEGVITHRNPGHELTNEFFKMVDLEREYEYAYWRWRDDYWNEDKLLNANKLLIELCNRAAYMFYEISDTRGNSCNRVYEKLLF